MANINKDPDRMIANIDNSEVGAFAAEVKKFHEADVREIYGATIAILPDGKRLESLKPLLDQFLAAPERRKGTAVIADTASFIAHIGAFASADSVIFAAPNPTAPKLTAVYDYHPAGDSPAKAGWLQHRAVYAPRLSDAWQAWLAQNEKWMGQAEFAAFIEDHVTDLIVPNFDDPNLQSFAQLTQGAFAEPTELVALSRSLQVNVAASVKNAVNLSSGEIAVKYEEVHQDGAGQPIQVKSLFQICVPVFYAGEFYRIPARLRYRIGGGDRRLQWSYALVRLDKVFEDAFNGLVATVRQETGRPVYLGAPEQ